MENRRVNMQMVTLEKTYSRIGLFHVPTVVLYCVLMSGRRGKKNEIGQLDRSFCMIKVELFLYVSVMHVFLSFLFWLFVLSMKVYVYCVANCDVSVLVLNPFKKNLKVKLSIFFLLCSIRSNALVLCVACLLGCNVPVLNSI